MRWIIDLIGIAFVALLICLATMPKFAPAQPPREPSEHEQVMQELRAIRADVKAIRAWGEVQPAGHEFRPVNDVDKAAADAMPPAPPIKGIDRPAGSSWQWHVNDLGELLYKRLSGPSAKRELLPKPSIIETRRLPGEHSVPISRTDPAGKRWCECEDADGGCSCGTCRCGTRAKTKAPKVTENRNPGIDGQ